MNWTQRLTQLGAGTRVVVRYRIPSGFTDALGELVAIDDTICVIETRRGRVTVALHSVVAAKQVPPPPRRRNPNPAAQPPSAE